LGTSTTVSRALRYIAEGALDDGSVADLAARLGIGERHLRRLFLKHLGAAPLAVAQTQRVHFAKRMISETRLPMTRIAMDAGFASVRRFNAAVRKAYGRNSTMLRRVPARTPARPGTDDLLLRLAFRPPLPWTLMTDFLRARAVPGVEQVGPDVYRRSVTVEGRGGVVEVRCPDGGRYLELRVPAALSEGLGAIVAGARRLFDLGADPCEIAAQLGRDRALASRVARRPGVRVPGAWNAFEIAVRAIVGQQVTVQGATTIMGRLVEAYGTALPVGARNGVTSVFPTPARLAVARLDRLGMPRARAAAFGALARGVAAGSLRLEPSRGLDEAVAALCALPGVGPWTAHYIAMRALGEPDAFPEGDLGLRRALVRGRVVSARELARRAEAWRPWRAYAAMLLWTTAPKRAQSTPRLAACRGAR
jgi:AraC family transcriptional regulator of adaptative response / DNA-3-methyladenine glycosylase II